VTDLEKAIAMIALAEQTYIENYYGDNVIPLFTRNEVAVSTDADAQHVEFVEGQSL